MFKEKECDQGPYFCIMSLQNLGNNGYIKRLYLIGLFYFSLHTMHYHIILSILFVFDTVNAAPLNPRGIGLLNKVKGSKLFSGLGTFYEVGSGSCGELDSDSDLVVAVNQAQMANGANPNKNPYCDNMVSITGDKGTITAKVVDTCPACADGNYGIIPRSPLIFRTHSVFFWCESFSFRCS